MMEIRIASEAVYSGAINLSRRQRRIAMDGYRIFHPLRVAARISDHDGYLSGASHTKQELIALL